jgi:molybdopterin synthase catalytic subunit/molybdopterin converting factor small subunit
VSQPVQVEYFAAARELCGCAVEQVELPADPITASELLALLGTRHPRFAPFAARMRLAVNGELGAHTVRVRPGDQVAVLPPVAGGVGLCELATVPLSVDAVLDAVRHPGAGGIAVFLGVVRDHADGKPVARLDYEAHPTLALSELRGVLDEVEREQPGVRLAAQHRHGTLAIGDVAVIVAASAPHRGQAFEACRAAIDRLKQRVPIWKKEWAPDGSANWINLGEP